MYAGFDAYLLRSGGSRGLTSSASTLSMEYDKVETRETDNIKQPEKLINFSRAAPLAPGQWETMSSSSNR